MKKKINIAKEKINPHLGFDKIQFYKLCDFKKINKFEKGKLYYDIFKKKPEYFPENGKEYYLIKDSEYFIKKYLYFMLNYYHLNINSKILILVPTLENQKKIVQIFEEIIGISAFSLEKYFPK
jgi:hypothetical protein